MLLVPCKAEELQHWGRKEALAAVVAGQRPCRRLMMVCSGSLLIYGMPTQRDVREGQLDRQLKSLSFKPGRG